MTANCRGMRPAPQQNTPLSRKEGDIGVGGGKVLQEPVGIDRDIGADGSGADADVVVELGGFVDKGREELFHADGRTAAVDVSGHGEKSF